MRGTIYLVLFKVLCPCRPSPYHAHFRCLARLHSYSVHHFLATRAPALCLSLSLFGGFKMTRPLSGRLSSTSAHPPNCPRPEISAHAQWTRQPYAKATSKCQEPRPRWPEIDAVIQVLFRSSCVILNAVCLLMVVAHQDMEIFPTWTLVSVIYGLPLNITEVVSLTAPAFPPFHRFPRFPSVWLAGFDATAIALIAWSEVILLSPNAWRETGNGTVLFLESCPPDVCTTVEERRAVAVYGMGILTG
ncbi:hypothetical protein K491DRAFT_409630 [Lophiostoma macrostomum CBS 122681]|uniref:Uncharacterized protein n=1 Tax=Lophiostoma macrostomum CBS 122681 TaxID=1314788 RepID=A0A6A6T921_9PLEO|nr:hypothetical protein K491DRAFT_409630 [Lophiostoma macrostomum CBS 122681]